MGRDDCQVWHHGCTLRVHFRLSAGELELIDREAWREGLSAPQWVKRVALESARWRERMREASKDGELVSFGEER